MTWYFNGCPVSAAEYVQLMERFEPETWRKIQEEKRRLISKLGHHS